MTADLHTSHLTETVFTSLLRTSSAGRGANMLSPVCAQKNTMMHFAQPEGIKKCQMQNISCIAVNQNFFLSCAIPHKL